MRKLSLLLGALGGALGGYLLSNDKLREELKNAKDPEAAAKALGAHLQKDGKKIAGEARKFVKSPEVQRNLKKAQDFAVTKLNKAKKEVQTYVKMGKKEAAKAVKAARQSVQSVKKVKSS